MIHEIHRAVYASASAPHALNMGEWHTCETTHCRAGWITTLAGEAGLRLEDRFGPVLAAMLIYDASDASYRINPCRFFDDNEAAMKDIKRLAMAPID